MALSSESLESPFIQKNGLTETSQSQHMFWLRNKNKVGLKFFRQNLPMAFTGINQHGK